MAFITHTTFGWRVRMSSASIMHGWLGARMQRRAAAQRVDRAQIQPIRPDESEPAGVNAKTLP
jgi:hypothetical protein